VHFMSTDLATGDLLQKQLSSGLTTLRVERGLLFF
jgi:hypothetical protein